jgi:uncharacterized protein (DUF305 family)
VKRLGATIAVLLGLGVALAGCTAAPDPVPTSTAPVVQLGAPGEPNRTLSPEEVASLQLDVPYSEKDVEFIRGMLHHHAQALVMTELVNEISESDDVRLMAERMDISQRDEMDLMERWLQERGEPARDPDAPHDVHAGMPGLLSDEEIAELADARGEAFDVMFLQFMIRHHEGALQMVADLYASDAGFESAIDRIAREIEADQGIEIARMEQMLAALG